MGLSIRAISCARGRAVRAMFALSASALALLLFAPHTSPLFPGFFGGQDDSALFLLVGKGMAAGKVCYQDLFDHKGPVMFMTQALGYTINGRTGVWLLECLACAATFYTAWETLALTGARKTLPLVSGALLYLFLIGKGNLTEEFSLPLVMLCVYLVVRWLRSGRAAHPAGYSLIYGASFAALCLVKVTNATIVAFAILWAFVSVARARLIKNLLANLAAGMLGIAAVIVPIFVWFNTNGALGDMLYATFVHNFYYARINAHASFFTIYIFQQLLMYVPVVYAAYVAWRAYRQDNSKFALFVLYLAATGLASLLYVNRYMHYFLMFVPVFILVMGGLNAGVPDAPQLTAGTGRWHSLAARVKLCCGSLWLALIMVAYAIASLISMGLLLQEYTFTGEIRAQSRAVAAEAAVIPPDEKNSVIGYQIPSSYYLEANIIPCYKYFTLQEWYSRANPRILDDFIRYIGKKAPLWVMTLPGEDNAVLLGELDEHYECVLKGRYLWMYRLREQENVTVWPSMLKPGRDGRLM